MPLRCVHFVHVPARWLHATFTAVVAPKACDDARRARLLVLECTGIDEELPASMCHERGHIHLDDIVEKAHLLQNEVHAAAGTAALPSGRRNSSVCALPHRPCC